jgi:effector-binding domain-containing protein
MNTGAKHEPRLRQRAAQPYLAIPAHVTTEAEFRRAADRGFPELFGWLQEHRVEPSGPPFIRYLVFDKDGPPVEIELAVPVGASVAGDERVRDGVLAPGRYLTLLHVGPYSSTTAPDLRAAHSSLRKWANEHGVVLDSRDTARGWELGGCSEHYLSGPVEEPDHSKWETELAYLTSEASGGAA